MELRIEKENPDSEPDAPAVRFTQDFLTFLIVRRDGFTKTKTSCLRGSEILHEMSIRDIV